MRRMVPIVALVLAVGFAGCLSFGPADSDGATPTGESTPTDAMPSTDLPRESGGNVSVAYDVTSGGVPEELASVRLTMQVVFVESEGDFSDNTCWRETYTGPYKPEITPIRTPSGECRRTEITVDLTEIDTTRTIEETPPARFDTGHGLIVTEIDATHQNGTSITTIQGIGGYRANIVEGEADRQYTVEFTVEPIEGDGFRGSEYYITSEIMENTP